MKKLLVESLKFMSGLILVGCTDSLLHLPKEMDSDEACIFLLILSVRMKKNRWIDFLQASLHKMQECTNSFCPERSLLQGFWHLNIIMCCVLFISESLCCIFASFSFSSALQTNQSSDFLSMCNTEQFSCLSLTMIIICINFFSVC